MSAAFATRSANHALLTHRICAVADGMKLQRDPPLCGSLSHPNSRQRERCVETLGRSAATTPGEEKAHLALERYRVPPIRDFAGQCRTVVTADRVGPLDEHRPITDRQVGFPSHGAKLPPVSATRTQGMKGR